MPGAVEHPELVYLDHAATTPTRPEAVEAMLPWLTSDTGNASGAHRAARRARVAVDDARDRLAQLLGCRPSELIFTGGGTESDNLAVAGRAGRLACSAVEHHAVLDPVRLAGGELIPVRPDGVLDVDAVPADASFLSVMLVNNEVGTVQPIGRVREAAPDAVLHTDAVQALPWLDVASAAKDADLVSVTGHKLGGPQGVGALVVRGDTPLTPILRGGGQEQGRRAGTSNVAGIRGLVAAVEACARDRARDGARLAVLRDRLVDGLLATPGATETGDRAAKVPGIASLCFDGLRGDELVLLLDQWGICASAGASCASGAVEPSHVLVAMGVPRQQAKGSLRLSLGWTTTDAEVDAALVAVAKAVEQLRGG